MHRIIIDFHFTVTLNLPAVYMQNLVITVDIYMEYMVDEY